MEPTSTIITYERTGDKVRPLKVRKAWIGEGANRRFTSVRITLQAWTAVHHNDWPEVAAPTRAQLIANGTITKPADAPALEWSITGSYGNTIVRYPVSPMYLDGI